MPKYNVKFRWEKYINFPVIYANNTKEAEEIAEEMLNSSTDLTELDGLSEWEIEKI